VAVMRRHSERQAARPRRAKRSMRRLNLVLAKTGSISCWALGVERGANVGRENAAHEGVAPAVPARAGVVALAGVGRDQDGDIAHGKFVHLDVVPVAGVGDDDLERVVDPGGVQLALGRGDHRLQVPEVR
jgi:hypothetical protein